MIMIVMRNLGVLLLLYEIYSSQKRVEWYGSDGLVWVAMKMYYFKVLLATMGV